jgi:uncharacterized DUF497 family protein
MISDAGFKWDEQNLEHIAQHMVGPDEAEAVLGNKPRVLRTGDGKYLAYGQTDDGRYLLVVYVVRPGPLIRVITARDMDTSEKKQHRGRRK